MEFVTLSSIFWVGVFFGGFERDGIGGVQMVDVGARGSGKLG